MTGKELYEELQTSIDPSLWTLSPTELTALHDYLMNAEALTTIPSTEWTQAYDDVILNMTMRYMKEHRRE